MYSRTISSRVLKPFKDFLKVSTCCQRSSVSKDQLRELGEVVVKLCKSCRDVCDGKSDGAKGVEMLTESAKKIGSLLGEPRIEVSKVANACSRALVGFLLVIQCLERESVETSIACCEKIKECGARGDREGVRSARKVLVSLLRQREELMVDAKGKGTVSELAKRVDQQQDVLQLVDVILKWMGPMEHPYDGLLCGPFFDPRIGRQAIHALASATLAGDKKLLMQWAGSLAEVVQQAERAHRVSGKLFREGVANMLALCQTHYAKLKSGGSRDAAKSSLAAQAKTVYKLAAKVATEQHSMLRKTMKGSHGSYGQIVETLIQLSLIGLGSDPEKTIDGYEWPAKEQKSTTTTSSQPKKVVAPDTRLPVMGSCAACGEDVHGRIVKALDTTFHPHHFTCTRCHREIGPQEAFVPDPKHRFRPVCQKCSSKALAEASMASQPIKGDETRHGPCAKCGRVLDGGFIEAMGRRYHSGCLQCGECGKVLDGGFSKGPGGFPLCKSCSQPAAPVVSAVSVSVKRPSRTTTGTRESVRLCKGCGTSIGPLDNVLVTGPDSYHKPCFKCGVCGLFLGGKNQDYFDVSGKMHCRECYSNHLYKCHACREPLRRDGSEVERDGHTFHARCAPSSRPSKPLPLPVPSSSPGNSPPPSPPPARPRWSQESLVVTASQLPSSTIEEDDLDSLMISMLADNSAPPPPLPKPAVRTSMVVATPATPSRRSSVKEESCWSCEAKNAVGYKSCRVCGESNLSIATPPQGASTVDWSVPEEGEFNLDEDGDALEVTLDNSFNRTSAADYEDLSKLIADLQDI